MARQPMFTTNVVLRATANSFEKHALMSTRLNASLGGPNGIPDMYATYHLKHLAYMAGYNTWKTQGGTQKGSTSQLRILLNGLPKAAYDWAYVIEGVYQKNTSQYLAMFPGGRRVFSTGTQLSRMNAVQQLSMQLTGITALATVKTSVDAMYAALTTLYNAQKSQISTTDSKSTALEALRIESGGVMFGILGDLIKMFASNPEAVKDYFPVDMLQTVRQKVFTGHLAKDARKAICKRTLKPGMEITLGNTGVVDVAYYMALTKDGAEPVGTIPVIVPPGVSTKVPVTALGNLTYKHLTVRNLSLVAEADWEIIL